MTDHITIPRALLEQALDELLPISHNSTDDPRGQADKAIALIRSELAKPTPTSAWNDALRYEVEDLRNVLRKLVEHDVTYWDSRGEVRHDVGTSQAEAMAIFREARQLLTPNAGNERPPVGGPIPQDGEKS